MIYITPFSFYNFHFTVTLDMPSFSLMRTKKKRKKEKQKNKRSRYSTKSYAADTLIGREQAETGGPPMMEGLIGARSCFAIHKYHECFACFWFAPSMPAQKALISLCTTDFGPRAWRTSTDFIASLSFSRVYPRMLMYARSLTLNYPSNQGV